MIYDLVKSCVFPNNQKKLFHVSYIFLAIISRFCCPAAPAGQRKTRFHGDDRLSGLGLHCLPSLVDGFDGFDGFDGLGLSEDGPGRAADLRAAPPTAVLRQPARKEREHLERAGPLRQQEDAFTSQTPSSRGEWSSVRVMTALKTPICQ